MGWLISIGMRIYDRNPKTYGLFRKLFFGEKGENNKLLIILQIIGYTFVLPILNHHAATEIERIHNDSSVFCFGADDSRVSFFLPDLDLKGGELIQNRIYLEQNYFENRELTKVKNYILEHAIILDIGANIGNHSVFFMLECGAEKVYAFEPTPHTLELLNKNIELNGLNDKCVIMPYALGSENTKCSIIVEQRDAGSNRTMVDNAGAINMVTLDSVLDDNVDFIKIDVEGFEYDVLIGGQNLIQNKKPIIYIEIFPENYDRVNDLLTGWGYSQIEKFQKDYIYKFV